MLKDLEPLSNLYSGFNCINLSISNILKYKNYPYFKSIWKQCGIHFFLPIDNSLGRLNGHYIPLKDELNLVHGIALKNEEENDLETYISKVSKLVELGEPVFIYVDSYKLNHTNTPNSMLHCLLVIGVEQDAFLVVDDAYNFKGKISKTELYQSTKFDYGWPKKWTVSPNFSYISLNSATYELNENDYYHIISLNNKINNNNISDEELKTIFNIPEGYKLIMGIEGMKAFSSNCKEYVRSNTLNRPIFNKLYSDLSNVANVHYLYAEFLKEASVFNKEFLNLSEEYQHLGQGWKVASNMMLKGMMKRHEEMMERMLNKVTNLIPEVERVFEISLDFEKEFIS